MRKKHFLVVSFGTSHHDTRENHRPDQGAYLAGGFPGPEGVPGLDQRDVHPPAAAGGGGGVDTVPAALERMLADGMTDVVVQPTHLLNGVENDAMIREAEAVRGRFQSLRIGGAPSDIHEDLEQMARILTEMFPSCWKRKRCSLWAMGRSTMPTPCTLPWITGLRTWAGTGSTWLL